MDFINKNGSSLIESQRLRKINVKLINLYNENNTTETDNALYWKEEEGTKVLYFNGSPLKAGEWELEEGSEDILITRDTAKNLNIQNKNISNVEDLSTDSITLNNDEAITTQTKIYKNGSYIYYGNERLNDNTHGLWVYDNVSETRLRPKTNSSAAYPNLELKDKAIQGLLQAEFKHQVNPINSPNAGYALLYNIQPSGNYSKPYLYLDNKPVSPFRYYLEPSDQSDTYTSQYGLNMSGNFLENVENFSTTANSENLIKGTSTTINSPLTVDGGGSITGQNTFTIGNTTLNLGSAFTNLTSAVNFKNSSICNLENGNEFYVYNQEKFFFYESDWVNLVGPANALNFYEVWDGNQFFSNRSEGFKNKDAHQNFGHYLYAYKMFNRIQERDSPNRYVMSVIGFLDGETTNGVVARPLFKFQSSDNYNNDGGSLPSGKSCVEMDRASVNIMFTSPRIIASKIKCNEIIANNLQTEDFISGVKDLFNFTDSAGELVGSLISSIGALKGGLILAGGLIGGGLLVNAGTGIAGIAMGGSSRNADNPGDPNDPLNKILYAGDNGALWNAAFWGRTNFGTNTLNYLTHAPIGMVLDPTNNNLLFDTLTNRDQLWKFGVNHLSQTFAVNMVGLTTDYGLSTTAFNQTDIFSNTIPGAYGNDYPCFAYEPIMGRSHGQELCSLQIKDYLDFDTAKYLNVNTRNYETVPKTNRLYCENGDLYFNGIITQNKVNNLGDNEFILNTAGDREQQFILNNDADNTQQRKIELILKQGSNPDEFRFNTLDNSFNPIGGDLIVGNSANIELRHNLTTLRTNTDVRETLFFKAPSSGNTQGGIDASESLDALRILGRVQGDPDYTLEEKMRIGINYVNFSEPTYHQFDIVMNVQNRGILFKDENNNNLLLTYSTENERLEFDGQPIGGGGGGGGGGNEDKYFSLSSNTATSASGINQFNFNTNLNVSRNDANAHPLAKFTKPGNASDSSIQIENGYTNANLKIGTQYYDGSWRNLILSDGGTEGQPAGNPRLTLIDSRYGTPGTGIKGVEITDRLKLMNATPIEFENVYGVENTQGSFLLTRGSDNQDGEHLYFNGSRIDTGGNILEKDFTENQTMELNGFTFNIQNGTTQLLTIDPIKTTIETDLYFRDDAQMRGFEDLAGLSNLSIFVKNDQDIMTLVSQYQYNEINHFIPSNFQALTTNEDNIQFTVENKGILFKDGVNTQLLTYNTTENDLTLNNNSISNKYFNLNGQTAESKFTNMLIEPQAGSNNSFIRIKNEQESPVQTHNLYISQYKPELINTYFASFATSCNNMIFSLGSSDEAGTNSLQSIKISRIDTANDVKLSLNSPWAAGTENTIELGGDINRYIKGTYDEGVVIGTNKNFRIENVLNQNRYYDFKMDGNNAELDVQLFDQFQLRTFTNNLYEFRSRLIPGQSFGADIFIDPGSLGRNLHMGLFENSAYEAFIYTTQFRVALATNGGTRFTFQNSDFTCPGVVSATGYLTTSDERIKKNIHNLKDDECLNIVKSIEPKKYGYIDHHYNSEEVVGFIAQELEPYIPSAVNTEKGYLPYVWGNVNIKKDIIKLLECDTNKINVGDKIELNGVKEGTNEAEVLKIISETEFKVNIDYEEEKARLLGVIVDDKKQVKLNRLVPVLWSATQELIKKDEENKIRINGLISLLAEKEVEITSLNNKINRIEKILLSNNLK